MTTLRMRNTPVLLFSQILETATRSNFVMLNASPCPQAQVHDSQIVFEFRSKLRQTEDLIAKLGYSLRQITERHP